MSNNKANKANTPTTPTTLEELEELLKDAKKGIARVDKKYVDYKEKGHLFYYHIDFKEFLENITYILDRAEQLKRKDNNVR